MDNEIATAAVFAWAPFGCLVVGALYFISGNKSAGLGRLVLTASYAPLAALIYLSLAVRAPAIQSSSSFPLYIATLLLSLGLLGVSLRWFPGPRWVHGVLVPVALICMAWQFVWGYFYVFGK